MEPEEDESGMGQLSSRDPSYADRQRPGDDPAYAKRETDKKLQEEEEERQVKEEIYGRVKTNFRESE